MAIIKGAISFGSNFNIGAKGPIDSRMRVETKTDLTTVWTKDIPAFKGMSVVTMDTGKIWVLIDEDYTIESNWKEPSPKPVIDATNYTDAKSKATTENIGQIVNVANEENFENGKYTAGLYVVTGNNEVAKLGTTTASGDLSGDVEKLKGDVNKLNGEDIVDGSVKKQIKDAKDALETEIDNVKKTHTEVSGATGNTHVIVETATDASTSKQTVTITESDIASKEALDALTTKVGNEASGDTGATGVFKYVDEKVANVKHPKYTVSYDNKKGEYNLKMDGNAIECSQAISFKDYMVRSGSVVKGSWNEDKTAFTENTEEITSGTSTAIKLVLNVKDATGEDISETIYIDATSLVDTYTVAERSKGYLTINGYTISLSDDAIVNIGKVPTIESGLSALTKNALKEIKVNEKLINSGTTAITLTGADIKTASAIDTSIDSGTSVDTVLSGIYTRIKQLDGSKVASVTAKEKSGVVVDNTDSKTPKVSLNLESATDNTVAAGHIAIKVNDEGQLYGEMYYDEGIPEKTTPETPTGE